LFASVAVGASSIIIPNNNTAIEKRNFTHTQYNPLEVLHHSLNDREAKSPAALPAVKFLSTSVNTPIPVTNQKVVVDSTPTTPLQHVAASRHIMPRLERPIHTLATPTLDPGDRVVATVSFYYCLQSVSVNPSGDGGGFCGAMKDGRTVYSGAAACDYTYLGQRFRVIGDPLRHIYTCNDTGSAVHGLHRDIWFFSSDEGWAWQRAVGTQAILEIVP
jgi:hypothetical protein